MKLDKLIARSMFKLKWMSAEILKAEYKETSSVPTACVIRREQQTIIRINPNFMNTLNPDLQASALVHEHLHVLLNHHTRMLKFKHLPRSLLNHAADCEVNSIIKDMHMHIHESWSYEPRFHGWPMEKIIRELIDENTQIQEKPQQSNQEGHGGNGHGDSGGSDSLPDSGGDSGDSGTDSGGTGNAAPAGREDPAVIEPYAASSESDLKHEVNSCNQSFMETCIRAQQAGKLPEGMARMLKTMQTPPLDWRTVTSDFIYEAFPDDYSFKRPKEFQSCLLPTQDGEQIGNLVFAIDCSGSVSDKELNIYGNYVIDAINVLNPQALCLLWFDTRVYPQTFDCPQTVKLSDFKPKGFGGTDYRPIFTHVNQHIVDPVGLIILTDGECRSFPPATPAYPVLWLQTQESSYAKRYFKPKFGRIVPIKNF